jgi:hypothetical protein
VALHLKFLDTPVVLDVAHLAAACTQLRVLHMEVCELVVGAPEVARLRQLEELQLPAVGVRVGGAAQAGAGTLHCAAGNGPRPCLPFGRGGRDPAAGARACG